MQNLDNISKRRIVTMVLASIPLLAGGCRSQDKPRQESTSAPAAQQTPAPVTTAQKGSGESPTSKNVAGTEREPAPPAAAPAVTPDQAGGAARAAGGGLGSSFEGQIDMTVTSAKARGPQPISFLIKGDQVRYDLMKSANFSQPVHGVFDVSDRKLSVVSDSSKTYTTVDLTQIPTPGEASRKQIGEEIKDRARTAAEHWDVRNTGTQDKVAGADCTVWEVARHDSKAKTSVCLAENLPRFDLERILPEGWLPSSWSDHLNRAAFPLRVRNYNDQGKQVLSAEVTAIAMREVDANKFEPPPEDYKQTTLRERITRGLPAIPGVPNL